jgi:hypothetical protein
MALLQLNFSSRLVYKVDSRCFPNVQNLAVLYSYTRILPINFTPKKTNVFDTNTSRRMYSYKENMQRQVKQKGG